VLDHTLLATIFDLTGSGINSAVINQYFDFDEQDSAPASPGVGVNRMRIYVRDGNLYSKFADSAEQQIPFGAPPGPAKRREFWYAGG
jgi:hypothetical protein